LNENVNEIILKSDGKSGMGQAQSQFIGGDCSGCDDGKIEESKEIGKKY
jgi:hypothetical protein